MIENYKAARLEDSRECVMEQKSIAQLKKLSRRRAMEIRLRLMRIDFDNLSNIHRGLSWSPSPTLDLTNILEVRRAERILKLGEILSILKQEMYWLIAEVGSNMERCRISPGMLNKRNLFLNRIRLRELDGLSYLHLKYAKETLNNQYKDKDPAYIVDSI